MAVFLRLLTLGATRRGLRNTVGVTAIPAVRRLSPVVAPRVTRPLTLGSYAEFYRQRTRLQPVRPRVVGLSPKGKRAVGAAALAYKVFHDKPRELRATLAHVYGSKAPPQPLLSVGDMRKAVPGYVDPGPRKAAPAPAYSPKAGGLVEQMAAPVREQLRAGRCIPRPDDGERIAAVRKRRLDKVPPRRSKMRFIPWCQEGGRGAS